MVFTSNYPTFRIISNTFCKFSREVFPDVPSTFYIASFCLNIVLPWVHATDANLY